MFAYASLIICVNKEPFEHTFGLATTKPRCSTWMHGTWGVDPDEFFPGLERQATAAKRLLFVGRLAREKGILDLLAAFGQVHDIFPGLPADVGG